MNESLKNTYNTIMEVPAASAPPFLPKKGSIFGENGRMLIESKKESGSIGRLWRYYMWGILVALISGALMSIQGVFNTEVTKQTSLWVSTGWVQLSAFAVCVLAWIFTGRDSIAALWQVENKYTLLGGVIGAFITITVIQSMGSLGPARAAMLIVISQLAVAYVIELFGLFGVEKVDFEWRRLLGMAIAIVGIVIFKWEK